MSEKPKCRVLLMDDEKIIRASVGKLLRKIGYQVDLASNGTQAFQMYKEKFEGLKPKPFWNTPNIEKEIKNLTIDGLYEMYQHFSDPELRKPRLLSRKKPEAVQITDLLEPIVEIRVKLREKEAELQKHKRIVAG